MKKNNKGFSLLELQMAAVLMVTVLIATGVLFYFSLAGVLYLQDAFRVYYNASNAMKFFTEQVMVSNCYGNQFRNPNYTQPIETVSDNNWFYGTGTPPGGQMGAYIWMPHLNGNNAPFTCTAGSDEFLALRQEVTQKTIMFGETVSVVGDFTNNMGLAIYLTANTIVPGGPPLLCANRAQGDAPALEPYSNAVQLVAENIISFTCSPIAYNCLAVSLTAQGTVASPLDGSFREMVLAKVITLRCAPSRPPIPFGASW